MLMLEQWLREFPPGQRILDLGCGCGSLAGQMAGLNVTGVDVDAGALPGTRGFRPACADSHRLPFAGESFDLVVCHHSLEHFHDVPGTVQEVSGCCGQMDGCSSASRMALVLATGCTVFCYCGGGHLQRFTFEYRQRVESGTGLHLAAWKELRTSYIFVNKINFLPAPVGPLPGPFPRRMRWLGAAFLDIFRYGSFSMCGARGMGGRWRSLPQRQILWGSRGAGMFACTVGLDSMRGWFPRFSTTVLIALGGIIGFGAEAVVAGQPCAAMGR